MFINQVITQCQSSCCRNYNKFLAPVHLKKSDPQLLSVARMFYESLAAITGMAILLGVLGHWLLRPTVQARLGTNPALPRDECPVARPSSWSHDSNS